MESFETSQNCESLAPHSGSKRKEKEKKCQPYLTPGLIGAKSLSICMTPSCLPLKRSVQARLEPIPFASCLSKFIVYWIYILSFYLKRILKVASGQSNWSGQGKTGWCRSLSGSYSLPLFFHFWVVLRWPQGLGICTWEI